MALCYFAQFEYLVLFINWSCNIVAKAGLYPASFSDLVKVEEGQDPRYKSVAIQTQYIMQHGKAMSSTQVTKLRKQLGLI